MWATTCRQHALLLLQVGHGQRYGKHELPRNVVRRAQEPLDTVIASHASFRGLCDRTRDSGLLLGLRVWRRLLLRHLRHSLAHSFLRVRRLEPAETFFHRAKTIHPDRLSAPFTSPAGSKETENRFAKEPKETSRCASSMEDGVVNAGGAEVEADEASDCAEPAGSAQSAGCFLDLSLERTEPWFNTPDKGVDDAEGRARRFGSARRFVSARRFGTPEKVPRAVRDYLNTVLSLSMSMVDGVVDAGGAEVEVDEASDYAEPAGSAQSAGVVDLSLELSAFEKQESNTPDEGFNDAVHDVLNTLSTMEATGSAQPSSAAPESDSTFEDAVSVLWQ
jgi:hypothetical protein